jgi:HEAT repeat protein
VAAVQRLEELEKDAAEALPELEAALKDESIFVRWMAVRTMAHLGPAAAAAVPALARTLSDPDRQVAREAAWAIGRTGPAARVARSEVLAAYRGGLEAAASAMAAIGPDAAEAVPDLVKSLGGKWPDTEVLRALASIGPAALPALPKLLPYLDHQDQFARRHAADAIRAIGPAAADAIPELLEKLGKKGGPPHHFDPAAHALGGMGEAAVPGLVEKLRSGPVWARVGAANAVRDIGKPAKAAVPALVEILRRKEDWGPRGAAISALGAIGPDARDAVPELRAISKAGLQPFASLAHEALNRIQLPRGK